MILYECFAVALASFVHIRKCIVCRCDFWLFSFEFCFEIVTYILHHCYLGLVLISKINDVCDLSVYFSGNWKALKMGFVKFWQFVISRKWHIFMRWFCASCLFGFTSRVKTVSAVMVLQALWVVLVYMKNFDVLQKTCLAFAVWVNNFCKRNRCSSLHI